MTTTTSLVLHGACAHASVLDHAQALHIPRGDFAPKLLNQLADEVQVFYSHKRKQPAGLRLHRLPPVGP